MLNDAVAELEDVAEGVVALVRKVAHLEQGLPCVTHGDVEQVEDLGEAGRGGREGGGEGGGREGGTHFHT